MTRHFFGHRSQPGPEAAETDQPDPRPDDDAPASLAKEAPAGYDGSDPRPPGDVPADTVDGAWADLFDRLSASPEFDAGRSEGEAVTQRRPARSRGNWTEAEWIADQAGQRAETTRIAEERNAAKRALTAERARRRAERGTTTSVALPPPGERTSAETPDVQRRGPAWARERWARGRRAEGAPDRPTAPAPKPAVVVDAVPRASDRANAGVSESTPSAVRQVRPQTSARPRPITDVDVLRDRVIRAEARNASLDAAAGPYGYQPHQSSRRPILVGAAAALVVVVAGVTVMVATGRDSHDRAGASVASPATNAPTVSPAVQSWVSANVPHTASVVTDARTATALRVAGFSSVLTVDPRAATQAGTWIVSTPNFRSGAPNSVLVASFGSTTAVRLTLAGSTPQIASALAADQTSRVAAGEALASNARIQTDAATGASLRAGVLDLRAETMLALVANAATIQSLTITVDPAEAAASRPARTMTLAVGDPGVITTVLAGLPANYRPAQVSSTGGRTTMTWPVAVAAVSAVP